MVTRNPCCEQPESFVEKVRIGYALCRKSRLHNWSLARAFCRIPDPPELFALVNSTGSIGLQAAVVKRNGPLEAGHKFFLQKKPIGT
jgi:hypothetical protein